MQKRSRIEIINDMLSLLNKNKILKPTHLMYKANLSHVQMKHYLKQLEKNHFILRKLNDNKNLEIQITKRGEKFLEKIKEMKEFENTFGLEK